MHMHTHIHPPYARTHARTHTRTHANTHTHTHTHTHTTTESTQNGLQTTVYYNSSQGQASQTFKWLMAHLFEAFYSILGCTVCGQFFSLKQVNHLFNLSLHCIAFLFERGWVEHRISYVYYLNRHCKYYMQFFLNTIFVSTIAKYTIINHSFKLTRARSILLTPLPQITIYIIAIKQLLQYWTSLITTWCTL